MNVYCKSKSNFNEELKCARLRYRRKAFFLVHFGDEIVIKKFNFFHFDRSVPEMRLFRLNSLGWRNECIGS